MSTSNGIKQVAMESGWLPEKILKHLVKNFSGKEFTLQDLKDDKVISKYMEPSKVTPKKTESKSSPTSPMKFIKENPETPIKFIQENPKKSGSKVHGQYEKYKAAVTYTEFSELGGRDDEFLWDYRKGFLQIASDGIENFTPAIKEKSKKESKKEKKPKKPKKAAPDPVALEPVATAEEPAQEPDNVASWWSNYNEECATNMQQIQEPAQEPVAADEELDEDLSEDNGSGTLVETVVDHPQQEANDSGEDDSDDDSDGDGDDNGFNPFNISAENSDDDDDDDGL